MFWQCPRQVPNVVGDSPAYPRFDAAVIEYSLLEPGDEEVGAFRRSLGVGPWIEAAQQLQTAVTHLVLYTRKSVEHDCAVPSWNVINTGLEGSSGNYDRD